MNRVPQYLVIDTDIVACKTIRDENGLAFSSRNQKLNTEQYNKAVQFPRLLTSKKTVKEIKKELTKLGFRVDYIKEFQGRRYGAVKLGEVRLIDNTIINPR